MTPAERVAELESLIANPYGGMVATRSGHPYIILTVEKAEWFRDVAKAAVEFAAADDEWDAIHDEDVPPANLPSWEKRMVESAVRGQNAAIALKVVVRGGEHP